MASKPVVGVCATCGCPAKQWCSKCNSIYFCGKDCQRQAWPEHKKLCAALQEEYLKTHPPKKQQEGTKQPQQKPQKRQQDVNLRSKWWRLRAGAYRTKEELLQLMEPFDLPEGLSEHEENARIKRMFGLCDIQETLKFYPPQGDNWYHYGLADPTNRSGPVNQVASRTTHRNLARPIHGDVFIVKSGPTWTGHFPGISSCA